MQFSIYKCEKDETEPRFVCTAKMLRAGPKILIFDSQEWLPAALGLRYYVKRKLQEDGPEEWWEIDVPEIAAVTPPYIYTAKWLWKYKDVAISPEEPNAEDKQKGKTE